MKKIAFLSIVVSFISIVLILLKNNIPVEVLSKNIIAHVNVRGLSFKNPELIFEKENLKLAPMIVDHRDELVREEAKNHEQEALIGLSKSNLKDRSCIQLGPLNEDKLSQLRIPLKKVGLIDRMIIEAIPANFSYELFLGPYSTKMEASKELLRLEKEGAASLQMFFKNNKEVFIKVREFSDMEEAENWSRFFVNKYHLNKVRLSRASNKDRNLVQLIFPEVDLKRAQTLLNLANKKRIPIYHCQLK